MGGGGGLVCEHVFDTQAARGGTSSGGSLDRKPLYLLLFDGDKARTPSTVLPLPRGMYSHEATAARKVHIRAKGLRDAGRCDSHTIAPRPA